MTDASATAPQPSALRRHKLLRPLWLLLVFTTVLLAVVQVAGRISLGMLSIFEDELNVVLGTYDVEVSGLQGGWRHFNPTIAATSVRFGAGEVRDAALEVDLLRTLWHGAVVLRSGSAEASIHLDKHADGWRLRGEEGTTPDFDLDALWRYSEVVEVGGALLLHDLTQGQRSDRMQVQATLRNTEQQRWIALTVHHADAAEHVLEVQLRQETLLGQSSATAVVNGALILPQTLLDMPQVRLDAEQTHWLAHGDHASGRLDVRVTGLQVGDQNKPLHVALQGEFGGTAVRTVGQASASLTGEDGTTLTLAPLYLSLAHGDDALDVEGNTPSGPLLRAWLAHLQLEAVSGFISSQLPGWEPAGRWINALALRGELHNLHVYVDEDGPGFAASVADLQMRGYKGAPTLSSGQGQIWGHNRAVTMALNTAASYLAFPDLYHAGWDMQDLQGQVTLSFTPGHLGLRGTAIKGATDGTKLAGSFAITRPNERYEQRVSLLLAADRAAVSKALTFIPFRIPPELARWLETGPRGGTLSELEFAYHGQVHIRPGELGRRSELRGRIVDGVVQYHPDWPMVEALRGFIHAAGPNTHMDIASARSLGWQVENAYGVLRNNGAWVDLQLRARSPAEGMLDFVRNSPLQDTMTFIRPGWEVQGGLQLSGSLTVPLKRDDAPELAASLALQLDDLDLDMPDFRIRIDDLSGAGTFGLPHQLQGEFSGRLFDAPVQIAAGADDDWLRFDLNGRGRPTDVYRVIDFAGEFPAAGAFEFDAYLHLGMAPELVSFMEIETDLLGLDVGLPGHLAKAAATPVRSEFKVQFLRDYQTVFWRYLDTEGWLHVEDEVKRGAIGLSARPPVVQADAEDILISGTVPRLRLTDWVADGEGAVSLPLDWRIENLGVAELLIDEVGFADVVLNGGQVDEAVHFEIASSALNGRVDIPASGPMLIDLAYVVLPATPEVRLGEIAPDPLEVSVGYQLPAADVNVERLVIGDEPFGSWSFAMRPQDDAVVFRDFRADVNGVHVVDSEVSWDLLVNRTHFKGGMQMDDLIETLPLWDYAPSVQTTTAALQMDAGWPGSPLNVEILGLTGDVQFQAEQGRLLDMETGSNGGLKILSLINFSKITKRMSFDFSDVVGDGLAFNEVDAKLRLQAGRMSFTEPMLVDSASSIFQVGGTVDLHSGVLDNEMIVTLPVSANLPWYGVYLALANPLAGLGVIVGGRMLRKPIQQFSSAKFAVGGTLEQPEVNFVALFDQSVKSVAGEPATNTTAPVDASRSSGD
ncbi:MAG: AsmA-like C-terminal region-containing protein [Pseudomonadota bacterium]